MLPGYTGAGECVRRTCGCANNRKFSVNQVSADFVATTTIMPFSVIR